MTVPLSQDILRACYNFLNETPPFNKWNLPDGDDIVFKVATDRTCNGWYVFKNRKHLIAISSGCVGHTSLLISTMAHEMIHVHEQHAKACKPGVEHSAAFKRWAAQVSRIHGFDVKAF